MTTEPGREASWSDIADWYDELLQAGSGPHELAVSTTLRLVPDLPGEPHAERLLVHRLPVIKLRWRSTPPSRPDRQPAVDADASST
jgi:hypothetical protein